MLQHRPALSPDAYSQILLHGDPLGSRVIVAFAAVAGIAVILRDSRSWDLPPRDRFGLLLAVFLGGFLGATIPAFVAGGWIQGVALRQAIGPKSILGGLAFGFFGAAIYKKVRHIPLDTSDAFAPGTALMMAIGRLGCFVNHCCFGIEWPRPVGMDFGDGVSRLPVQLVEAACTFALFAALAWMQARDVLPHRRLFILLAAYGVERFLLEFLRAPISAVILGLGAYHWFALAVAALGAFQILRRTQKYARN